MTAVVEAAAPSAPHLSDDEREDLRRRLVPAMPDDGWWGWVGPLAVTALALVLRLWDLGRPHAIIVDETYYVKDALSLLRYGSEQATVNGADKKILAGNLDVFSGQPEFVVHPPFGKWVIASGQWMFGTTPFGWRFPMAIVGTLSVWVLARTVRRMTRSTLLGSIAGFLLALDGLHLVLSRTAYLDITLTCCVVVAFSCLVVDRDRVRQRALDWALARNSPSPLLLGETGPRFGFRPWRLAAGVALGLACGTKWSGIYYVAAFGLLLLWWDRSARSAVGVRRPLSAAMVKDALPDAVSVVGSALVVYVLTWSGWLLTDKGYGRQWAETEGANSSFGFIPAPLRSLWHYHVQMYNSSEAITSPHAYASTPLSWPILGRPVAFFYETKPECGAVPCVQAVTALGNPAIWWGGCLALVWAVWLVISRRDWRASAALVGLAAGWLPWFWYSYNGGRTVFQLYSVVFLPFTIIAIVLLLGTILGPPDEGSGRRVWGAAAVGCYLIVVVVLTAQFWPVLTAQPIPHDQWQQLMWFRSWI